MALRALGAVYTPDGIAVLKRCTDRPAVGRVIGRAGTVLNRAWRVPGPGCDHRAVWVGGTGHLPVSPGCSSFSFVVAA
ncbi:hypothetical protein [Streptomyces blattellae]|uniref:hypothetical protein n=1 Tax=Streptomyces blattellae TaxID=2569855 RepID=UPI0012B80680|nr:hypothetical protein [Streptomyces blattellae]